LRFRTSRLDVPGSYRTSYDYLGAYTFEPIEVTPPELPVPKVPVMWDSYLPSVDEFNRYLSQRNANHVFAGGNVLWLDGSVTFMKEPMWAGVNLPYRPAGLEFLDPAETAIKLSKIKYIDPYQPDEETPAVGVVYDEDEDW
jgi:prepilin-type processing-associated H-X9-DG protein